MTGKQFKKLEAKYTMSHSQEARFLVCIGCSKESLKKHYHPLIVQRAFKRIGRLKRKVG